MDRRNDFEQRVVAVLRTLRPGDVVTYGEVAAEAGHPGAGRAVGNVLAQSEELPWWRVVTTTGRLVPGHETEHARLLAGERVRVVNGRVPLRGARPVRGRPTGRTSGRRSPS